MSELELWNRYKECFFEDRTLGFSIDISRVRIPPNGISDERMKPVFKSMDELVKGAIANPDEKRMVGHYWLRDSSLAPTPELKKTIEDTLSGIKDFAKKVHSGEVVPSKGKRFRYALIIGIGGSALGPQFVNNALTSKNAPLNLYFFDNTDPDGMEKVLNTIPDLSEALCVVISKSGGTKETRNGQFIAKEAWKAKGLNFASHFIAVTGDGSELDATAKSEGWLARFPMWDWVGGRTSELSAVGLLPAALSGIDIDAMLKGAKDMDALTSNHSAKNNPAALLALSWYHIGGGKGLKDMVVLPYKDRLELFSRYLQQLVMESLGKERDLSGAVVNQGIAVYGNKGSTDQHAYVQQLRDGVNNFFVTFIEVLKDSSVFAINQAPFTFEVEPGVTTGDYLSGFLQGTRKALFESGRESITITVREVSAHTVGMLIALFERAVGFYGTLVNINAYHQPGVEAGKKAAAEVLTLQSKLVSILKEKKAPLAVEEVASLIKAEGSVETIFKILRHLEANGRIKAVRGASSFEDRYSVV